MWRHLLLIATIVSLHVASARLPRGSRIGPQAEVVEQCEADETQNIRCVLTYLYSVSSTAVSLGVVGVGPLVRDVLQYEEARSPAWQRTTATMELNFTTSAGTVNTYTESGVNYWNDTTSEILIAVHDHGNIQDKHGYVAVQSPRLSYAGTISYVNLLASNQAFYYKDWDEECLEVKKDDYTVRKYFTSESGVTNTFVGIYSDSACSKKLSVSKKCTVHAGGIYYVVVSGDNMDAATVKKFGESNTYCKSDGGDQKDDTETIILVACIFGGIGILVGAALIMAQLRKRQLRELELEELEKSKPPSQDEIQARMAMKGTAHTLAA